MIYINPHIMTVLKNPTQYILIIESNNLNLYN